MYLKFDSSTHCASKHVKSLFKQYFNTVLFNINLNIVGLI